MSLPPCTSSDDDDLIKKRHVLAEMRRACVVQQQLITTMEGRQKAARVAASQKNTEGAAAAKAAAVAAARKAVLDKAAADARAARIKAAAAARITYSEMPLKKVNGKRGGLEVIPGRVLQGRIGRSFPRTRNKLPRGYPAGLNRCYRNSVLQCVFHTPEFYHLLGNIHKDCPYETNECITCSIQYMVKAYWDGSGGAPEQALRSTDLGSAIRRVFTDKKDEDVRWGDQSDPFDLMFNFVRYIERDVTGKDTQFWEEPPIRDSDPQLNLNQFTIGDVFNFDYTIRWTCVDCGDVKPEVDESDFGLDVKITRKEKDWYTLNTYFNDAEMSPFINVIPSKCDSATCAARRATEVGYVAPEQTKRRRIKRAPDILLLRLNRVQDTKSIFTQKIDYPQYLDLSWASASGERILYVLRGVVSHFGSTRGGHYMADVMCRSTMEERVPLYCHINESSTAEKTNKSDRMLDPHNSDAYVLVYSRLLNG